MSFFGTTTGRIATSGYTIGETILEVKGISKGFNGKQIISDVNFKIDDVIREGHTTGQILSLIGKSGVGKTVFFNILAGFMEADEGEILLHGKQIRSGDIGVVPQNYILFNHYTIRKNLSIANKKGKFEQDYVDFLVNKFDLGEQLDKYPIHLSGGQRQRVSILQQVLSGHDFILCDEPFSGLDYPTIQKVKEVMLHVANLDEKNTIIIISHDIESSLSISDAALIMNKADDNAAASINKIFDLKSMGLAWRDTSEDPQFHNLVKEVRNSL